MKLNNSSIVAGNYVEFNMGVASMQRIDSILQRITALKVEGMGRPVQGKIQDLLWEWYKEVYSYLDTTEREYANSQFFAVFNDRKTKLRKIGTSLRVFNITQHRMDEMELWLMDMMFKKGILTKIGESPYDIEI